MPKTKFDCGHSYRKSLDQENLKTTMWLQITQWNRPLKYAKLLQLATYIYLTKVDKLGINISIWCVHLQSDVWSKCSENSVGTVVILPLVELVTCN